MRLFDKLWELCKYIITGIPLLEQKQESYNIPVKDKLIIVLTLGVKNVHIEKQYDLSTKLEDFCNRKLDDSVVVLKAFDFDRPMCIEWSVLSSKNMSEEELTKFIERTEKAAAEYLECLQQNK